MFFLDDNFIKYLINEFLLYTTFGESCPILFVYVPPGHELLTIGGDNIPHKCTLSMLSGDNILHAYTLSMLSGDNILHAYRAFQDTHSYLL